MKTNRFASIVSFILKAAVGKIMPKEISNLKIWPRITRILRITRIQTHPAGAFIRVIRSIRVIRGRKKTSAHTHIPTAEFRFICGAAAVLLFMPCASRASMITGILTEHGEKLPTPNAKEIGFKIGFDSELKTTEKTAKDGHIVIYCSWRNITDKPVLLLLKDHDSHYGKLDYPFGIQIRITNSEGVIVTANSQYKEGWWDFSCYCSQLSKLMPGDIITLKPKERIIRSFKIDDVLMRLTFIQAADKVPRTPDGVIDMTKVEVSDFKMPKGKNRIEVKYWDMIATNSLTLNIE